MAGEIVVDASIFNKTYLDEPDRLVALSFFEFAKQHGLKLIAPSIFVYEVLAVAAPSPYGAEKAYELILSFKRSGFLIVDASDAVIHKAIEISNSGHPKSGYPTFYDSSYHALALLRGGTFLTSDQRHAAKSSGFGGVVLLKDWRAHFNASLPS
jgi:predicted nucleic acid-binding protein